MAKLSSQNVLAADRDPARHHAHDVDAEHHQQHARQQDQHLAGDQIAKRVASGLLITTIVMQARQINDKPVEGVSAASAGSNS